MHADDPPPGREQHHESAEHHPIRATPFRDRPSAQNVHFASDHGHFLDFCNALLVNDCAVGSDPDYQLDVDLQYFEGSQFDRSDRDLVLDRALSALYR